MQLSVVLAKVKTLKHHVFQTRDVAALLKQPVTTVSRALSRLAADHHLIHLRKNLWAIAGALEPFALPNYLTAPYPSYISLHSALYHHGMIEQIPDIIYAVSISRTKVFSTPLATVSIHHIPTELFFGYQTVGKTTKIAIPEKALFDFVYLQPAKTRLFTNLPELELPRAFNKKLFLTWSQRIKSLQRRAMVVNRYKEIIQKFGK